MANKFSAKLALHYIIRGNDPLCSTEEKIHAKQVKVFIQRFVIINQNILTDYTDAREI